MTHRVVAGSQAEVVVGSGEGREGGDAMRLGRLRGATLGTLVKRRSISTGTRQKNWDVYRLNPSALWLGNRANAGAHSSIPPTSEALQQFDIANEMPA